MTKGLPSPQSQCNKMGGKSVPLLAGTFGGTLAALKLGDTVVTAMVGALVSFVTSLLLKRVFSKATYRLLKHGFRPKQR